MIHAKILTSIAMATLILTGCASSGPAADGGPATAESYNSALAAAKNSIKAAKSANFEWRDSVKILKKADKAAKAGDFEMAQKLAMTAKRQGDLALQQSKDQAAAGPIQ